MTAAEVLVVDDDPRLREVVRYALSRAGFVVREAGDGAAALRAVAERPVDLVVLDVLMPELDGLAVCRELRRSSDVPVVFLSSRDEELDRVLGLEIGGDDYVTKPFSPRELVSRVKAVLRRTRTPRPTATEDPDSGPLKVGEVTLDPHTHRVHARDHELELTATEFRLLQALMTRPGRVYSRAELVSRAYEGHHHVSDRTVDSHIRRVRQKFRDHDLDPIETVHGVGFRLREA